MKKQKFDKKQRTQALSNLKEAADAAVAGAGDTVDLSSDEGEDKILDADESDNSDVENNNAEENQAVEDEDVNDKQVNEGEDAFEGNEGKDKQVNEGEDAFEGNEGKDKQEHDTMDVVVQTYVYTQFLTLRHFINIPVQTGVTFVVLLLQLYFVDIKVDVFNNYSSNW